jgi:hypothetical protein
VVAMRNLVENILDTFVLEHIQRLKDAVAALPDPNNYESSGLSFLATETSLQDDNPLQASRDLDADDFVVPARSDSSQNSGAKKK